ncbi:1,4-dihydroxy-2-naphthoate polyprenyltransferase [Eisenibacter elegans]|jgi:1,4-dihydroxy-2-naphthoate octaprenyltransferase|uniref:1,4-dihydroxy-2-naphthoate polyprenyltransferase n=1 Tax=Eisenibacter elegans TaxID=997 RepID=UPI00047D066C|nr:1,4-dihydroxy-2-naphthoate polyprenyltransferase [Eisenibacter elegans]
MIQAWISALRLRTLPLALAGIIMGSFVAAHHQGFRWEVLTLAALTAIFLQIVSNLANDYGDSIHGADSQARQGPSRAVQTGAITAAAMWRAVMLFALLALLSGLLLLWVALQTWQDFLAFLGLGLLAILAAITYTAGRRPYGYVGLGDLSVLIFFGLVAVGGTYYLHTHQWHWGVLLPALSSGLFATAVLNVNNIRDIASDTLAGKRSLPVRMGRLWAVRYHAALLLLGFGGGVAYVFAQGLSPWAWLFVLSAPLFWKQWQGVATHTEAAAIDPYLKQTALTTLLFVVLLGLGGLL